MNLERMKIQAKVLQESGNTFLDWLGKTVWKICLILLLTAFIFGAFRYSYRLQERANIAQEAKRIQDACNEVGASVTYRVEKIFFAENESIVFLCDWSQK